jgi:acyl dehydratase
MSDRPTNTNDAESVTLDFTVTAAEQRAFAELSGDYNPLHLDLDTARAHGFVRPVVYGAIIIAKLSQIIGMRIPGTHGVWSALKIDFRAPLHVDEAARLTVEVGHQSCATRSRSLRVRVTAGVRTIATATALVTLLDRGQS